jgi:hypothetical protein
MELTGKLRPAAHVFATLVDDQVRVLDTRTEVTLGLNELATRTWTSFAAGRTVGETLLRLQEQYEVEPAQLRSHVLEITRQMIATGLLEYHS